MQDLSDFEGTWAGRRLRAEFVGLSLARRDIHLSLPLLFCRAGHFAVVVWADPELRAQFSDAKLQSAGLWSGVGRPELFSAGSFGGPADSAHRLPCHTPWSATTLDSTQFIQAP